MNKQEIERALSKLRDSEVINRGGRYVAVKYTDANEIEQALQSALDGGWTKKDSLDVIHDMINCYTNKLHNEGGGEQTKIEQRFAIEVLEIAHNEIKVEQRQTPRALRGKAIPTPPQPEPQED